MGRTFNALSYSAGANVLSAVPCIGAYFGWIWWLISAVIMVKTAQRVSAWRAILAVVAPPAVVVVGFGVLWSAMGGGVAMWAGGRGFNDGAAPTTVIVDALGMHVNMSGGRWPAHAIELLRDFELAPEDLFIHGAVDPSPGGGDFSLFEYAKMQPNARARIAADLVRDLPRGMFAHRLGDYVFTYHGINEHGDPALWLVIESADPGGTSAAYKTRTVGTLGGATTEFSEETFPRALERQNKRRAKFGLPPLPDPDSITADTPATVGDPAADSP
jgi:hypothetical protein